MDYQEFLDTKKLVFKYSGITVQDEDIHQSLFHFQRDLTRWALKKGRSAIFADTGLGKSRMQIEWARLTGERSLIIAQLSVAKQTVGEARKIGLEIHYTRSSSDLVDGINITNYEMIDKFNPDKFGAVVLDESSILKGLDGKTRAKLTEMFSQTTYKLCCTATPAPNDIAEIANHAEFLSIMPRVDMLAAFFVHDDKGWRLKKHAEEPFYRWLASWGMSIRKPSDLGYSDDGFILPELRIIPVFTEMRESDMEMFGGKLKGITDRSKARKATLDARVQKVVELISADSDQWIAWCGLNDEGRELHKPLHDSILMEGQQKTEIKQVAIENFQDGKTRILITKPKIAGFGMNFQNCHKMAFVGLSDSWESYYQCIRRCYRFGQTEPVDAYIVLSEIEREVYQNILRKEEEARNMAARLIENVQQFERKEIQEIDTGWRYEMETVREKDYTLMLGDSVERMAELESESVDLSVYSPPFLSLYTYSPTERDMGNSRTEEDFYRHYGYIIDQLLRVTKPGRNTCCHVAQVPAMLVRDGYIGMKDFRGKTIKAYEDRGWIYHGEVCIDKCPQAQAIRTHSKGLMFTQLKKDASWLRPALADYILVFRKPGENTVPIKPDITNDEWIEWARPIWYGIKESDTLNVREGRDSDDERHIAPLQLGTIERCVRLWSNPGETVLSPFAGIGSEGYVSLKFGRRYVGIELKRSYFEAAKKNMERANGIVTQASLFDAI